MNIRLNNEMKTKWQFNQVNFSHKCFVIVTTVYDFLNTLAFTFYFHPFIIWID